VIDVALLHFETIGTVQYLTLWYVIGGTYTCYLYIYVVCTILSFTKRGELYNVLVFFRRNENLN
jgi:hypothetical protein